MSAGSPAGQPCPSCSRPLPAGAAFCPLCGTVLPVAAPSATTPGPALPATPPVDDRGTVHRRLAPRALTIVVGVAGGLLVVALAAVGVVQWIGSTYFGPEPVAAEYLEALHFGRAAVATQLSDPGIAAEDRAGLSDEVLVHAKARLASARVGDAEVTGDTATIPVEYSLDGQHVSAELAARRSGTTWLLFPTWRLTSSLVSQAAVTSPAGVSLGGVDVVASATSDVRTPTRLWLYPGTYSVTSADIGPNAKWFTFGRTTMRVTGDSGRLGRSGPASATVTVAASTALADGVTSQIEALIDDCATSAASTPRSTRGQCPFSTSSSDGKATWTVVSYPQVITSVDRYGVVHISVERQGSVRATTVLPGAHGSPDTTKTAVQLIASVPSQVTLGQDGGVTLRP